jgi:hypothetical protein
MHIVVAVTALWTSRQPHFNALPEYETPGSSILNKYSWYLLIIPTRIKPLIDKERRITVIISICGDTPELDLTYWQHTSINQSPKILISDSWEYRH